MEKTAGPLNATEVGVSVTMGVSVAVGEGMTVSVGVRLSSPMGHVTTRVEG